MILAWCTTRRGEIAPIGIIGARHHARSRGPNIYKGHGGYPHPDESGSNGRDAPTRQHNIPYSVEGLSSAETTPFRLERSSPRVDDRDASRLERLFVARRYAESTGCGNRCDL